MLRVAAPAGVAVYTFALGVDLGASVPIPDLVAFHRRSGRRRAVDPTDILLVAEVVVPVGSGSTTSASGGRTPGIAHYWIVDRDPIRVTALRLGDVDYTEAGQASGRSC